MFKCSLPLISPWAGSIDRTFFFKVEEIIAEASACYTNLRVARFFRIRSSGETIKAVREAKALAIETVNSDFAFPSLVNFCFGFISLLYFGRKKTQYRKGWNMNLGRWDGPQAVVKHNSSGNICIEGLGTRRMPYSASGKAAQKDTTMAEITTQTAASSWH